MRDFSALAHSYKSSCSFPSESFCIRLCCLLPGESLARASLSQFTSDRRSHNFIPTYFLVQTVHHVCRCAKIETKWLVWAQYQGQFPICLLWFLRNSDSATDSCCLVPSLIIICSHQMSFWWLARELLGWADLVRESLAHPLTTF